MIVRRPGASVLVFAPALLSFGLALPSRAATETPTPEPWQGSSERATPREVAIFPNPCAKTLATVGFVAEADAPAKVLLFNDAGAVVTEVPVHAVTGVNDVPLDLRRASPGVYYVRVHVRYAADRVVLLPAGQPAKFVVIR